MSPLPRRSRRLVVAVAVIGFGLALAPVGFRMFERAPKGGTMLDEFRPYMNEDTISKFQGWMDEMGAARSEVHRSVLPTLHAAADAPDTPALARFDQRWPTIDDEMSGMLDDMSRSLGDFAAVDALPPFPLFPWFFVLPGLLGIVLALAALRRRDPRRLLGALGVLGVALVAAPVVFQMFSRAPQGKEMIDTFRPLMTRDKVTRVQGYFLTLGTAEGELRLRALPALGSGAVATPAVERWIADWPRISNEMAPMVGTMADNLDNYAAVDALPPFSLFPWFFVAPGLLIAVLAVLSRRSLPALESSPTERPLDHRPSPTPERSGSPT